MPPIWLVRRVVSTEKRPRAPAWSLDLDSALTEARTRNIPLVLVWVGADAGLPSGVTDELATQDLVCALGQPRGAAHPNTTRPCPAHAALTCAEHGALAGTLRARTPALAEAGEGVRAWVLGADGTRLFEVAGGVVGSPGFKGLATELRKRVREARATVGDPALPHSDLLAATRRLRKADAQLARGELKKAWRSYRRYAKPGEVSPVFARWATARQTAFPARCRALVSAALELPSQRKIKTRLRKLALEVKAIPECAKIVAAAREGLKAQQPRPASRVPKGRRSLFDEPFDRSPVNLVGSLASGVVRGVAHEDATQMIHFGQSSNDGGLFRYRRGAWLRVRLRLQGASEVWVQLTDLTQQNNFKTTIPVRPGAWVIKDLDLDRLQAGGRSMATGDLIGYVNVFAGVTGERAALEVDWLVVHAPR